MGQKRRQGEQLGGLGSSSEGGGRQRRGVILGLVVQWQPGCWERRGGEESTTRHCKDLGFHSQMGSHRKDLSQRVTQSD